LPYYGPFRTLQGLYDFAQTTSRLPPKGNQHLSRMKVSIIPIFIENNNELTKRKFKYIHG